MARAFAQAGAKVAALDLNEEAVKKLTDKYKAAKILNGTPMGRYVESEELLDDVFFLCDDKAVSAITGVVLLIDAGFAACSGV